MTDIKQHAAADRIAGTETPMPRPMPEDGYYDRACIQHAGVDLIVGGEYQGPTDQWPGFFNVCSVRTPDSGTDIVELLTPALLETLGDLAYWKKRNG